MNATLVRSLIEFAGTVPTVDTHQHLGPETPVQTDLCQVLVQDNYLATALTAAGLTPEAAARVADPAVPLLQRWQRLKPYWEAARDTSYGRAHLITYRDLYGARDLGDGEIEAVSARLAEDFARPGLFRRVFAERCGIDAVLSQGLPFAHERPAFRWVARPLDIFDFKPDGVFDRTAREAGVEVRSADDVAPAMDGILHAYRRKGAVGFKLAALPWKDPTREEVKRAFAERSCAEAAFPLTCLCVARVAALAEQLDVPVAIHSGPAWTNWLDFRTWEPTALIPLLTRFRGTRFDLYHAGIPHVTPSSALGQAFPNVWLNLCWAHIISAELARRAMREWLDLVPVNKVLGFGGDYQNRTVSLTFGHLAMARQHMAEVLAERVEAGTMAVERACEILRLWLSDNPRRLYGLKGS